MTRNLLLSAAALVCLALPVAALADPPGDQGQNGGAQGHDQGKGQGKGQGQGAGPAAKVVIKGGGAPGGGAPAGGGGAGGAGRSQGANFGVQNTVTSHQGLTGQNTRRVKSGGPTLPNTIAAAVGAPSGGGGQPQFGSRRVTTHNRPANIPVLSGWTRAITGADRNQADQQWRQSHSGWDSSAPWRQNQNWWRGNAAFRLFFGERLGYFFIPELGYIVVPAEYQNHFWQAGDTLPSWFWQFQVNDYWNYGLPQPPDGCLWVWVDNDIALIDGSDGYIIDIVHNAW
jgi:Ni/Co efflux regulator RcnB